MTRSDSNQNESFAEDPREVRIGELINEFFDRRQNGESLSEEAFLAANSEYARELREHLGGLDLIKDLGSSGSDVTREAPVRHGNGSSAVDPLAPASAPPPEIHGYQILKQIGRGGMGVVFKAIQLSTKRVVALKLLLEGPLASESARKRFEREIALAAQLRHPGIIPIYDSGEADGRMYYAMEHVFGLALGDHARAHNLDIKSRIDLFVRICEPISHAHMRGVIHRDLKPSNILIDGGGDPHVLDFGLAKAGSLEENVNTSITAQIVGTPAYMSPEQASGDPTGIDIRVDVYALGVMLFELLTGQMPYDTNGPIGKVLHNIAHSEPISPSKLNPKIDPDLSTIIVKALSKRKEDRYQSVESLAGDLKRFLAGEPITAKPVSSIYLLKKIIFRHKLVSAVGAAAIFFAASIFAVVGYFSRQLETKAVILEQTVQSARRSEEKLAVMEEEDKQKEEKRLKAKAAYESALRRLEPDAARAIDSLANTVASSEDAPIIGLKLIAEMAGLAMENVKVDSPEKASTVDTSAPLFSKRPDYVPPPAKSKEDKEILGASLLRELSKLVMMPAAPEAAPASTQPAASQPTTDVAEAPADQISTSSPSPADPDQPS
ncbi:MAG: serine/threonine protein kinase [Planctomycetia bacterium]|nr:serine/threonine protein kinase [Planctomycetia bacterium]